MTVAPKLMMAAGIAVAGLGLIGAGAGATFTAQVAGSTSITTGSTGLSLDGGSGQDLRLDLDGSNLGTHFTPLRHELHLTNTGTLDLASTSLDLTASGCDGGPDAPLASSLRVTVTDTTTSRSVYDGTLCSAGERQLRHPLPPGDSAVYEVVLQPSDAEQGLPPEALDSHTSVRIVFSGSDE